MITPNEVRTIPGPSPGGRFNSGFPLWDGTNRIIVSWSQCRLLDPVDDRDRLAAFPQTARERGRYPGPVLERSLYTSAALHPTRTALAAAGIGLALAAGVRAMRSR